VAAVITAEYFRNVRLFFFVSFICNSLGPYYTFFVFAAIHLQHYFSDLAEKSWAVIPVDQEVALNLQSSARKRAAEFKPAGISQSLQPVKEIRNDKILWLDSATAENEYEKSVLKNLILLQEELRHYFRISLNEFECHFSIYDPGQYYARHKDTLKNNNKRIFSFVLYLNPEWSEADGGQIVGYDGHEVLFRIQPLAGQLLIFKSDVEHEVLPAVRQRFALTGWMRQ
jgi:SM-20-related protein